MRIQRVFNNNSVGALLPDGREAVLVGPGIGFNKRRGDDVDPAQVEKRFVLEPTDSGEGMRAILVSLPYPVVELTARVSARLAERHQIQLTPAVEIGLADHLAAALDRLQSGTSLYNNLLFETKATYKQEFGIALEVLDWVEELCGTRLPLDEAGFITRLPASEPPHPGRMVRLGRPGGGMGDPDLRRHLPGAVRDRHRMVDRAPARTPRPRLAPPRCVLIVQVRRARRGPLGSARENQGGGHLRSGSAGRHREPRSTVRSPRP